jgi:hypothetical protein
VAELLPKHSRPCTAVEFCSSESNLLAAGYEKIRNEPCLLIWDVESQAQGPSMNQNAGPPAHIHGMESAKSNFTSPISSDVQASGSGYTHSLGHVRHSSGGEKPRGITRESSFSKGLGSLMSNAPFGHSEDASRGAFLPLVPSTDFIAVKTLC